MPDQVPPPPGTEYERFLKSGEFRLQHCTACAKQIYYPRTLCPFCGSIKLEWRVTSGRGTVYSTTTVRGTARPGSTRCRCAAAATSMSMIAAASAGFDTLTTKRPSTSRFRSRSLGNRVTAVASTAHTKEVA